MISHAITNDVLEIKIDRPEKRNAITHEMYDTMRDLVHSHGNGDSVRAIIFYGVDTAFSAGADLDDFKKPRAPGESHGIQFIRALAACKVPVLAAVEGFAVGIGATMLLHCDFIYSTANCKFKFPFVALGLCPEAGSTYLLEKIVGTRKATDWLLTSRNVNGDEAYASGFINELVDSGTTLQRARERANDLVKLPQNSVNLAKQLMKEHDRQILASVIDREVAEFNAKLKTDATQSLVSKSK